MEFSFMSSYIVVTFCIIVILVLIASIRQAASDYSDLEQELRESEAEVYVLRLENAKLRQQLNSGDI